MVKLTAATAPSGRIETQLGLRRPKQTTQAVTVTREPTLEEVAAAEKEYYIKKGNEDYAKLQAEILRIAQKAERYKELAAGKTSRGKDATNYENKQDRYEDNVTYLKNLVAKAKSGKYDINDLKNYAYDKAYAAAENRNYKRKLKTIPKEKMTVEKMREQGEKYLEDNPDAFGGGVDPTTGERARVVEIKGTAPISTSSYFKDNYIESLTSNPNSNLAVNAYGGIRLPYGQKDVTWTEPQFGTLSSEYPTGTREVSLLDTMRLQEFINPDISKPTDVIVMQGVEKIQNKIIKEEILKSEKVMQDSIKKIQDKINSGEVSFEQGTLAISRIEETENTKLNKRISARVDKEVSNTLSSKEFEAKVSGAEKFRSTFKTSFSPEYKKESRIGKAELGADITAGLISGAFPAVGIAYFGGKTIYKGVKGADKDTIIVDEQFRDIGRISSKQTTEAGISSIFAVTSGIGSVYKIGSEITALRRTEILQKPWTVSSRKLGSVGDETAFQITGSKVVPGASADGKVLFNVRVGSASDDILGSGQFKILSGKGTVDFRVVDFMKQGVYSSGDDVIKSSIKYSTFGRGAVTEKIYPGVKLGITQGEGYITPDTLQGVKVTQKTSPFWSTIFKRPYVDTYIEGTYMPDKVSWFDFGGVSRKVGKETFFTSGRFTGAKLDLNTFGITGKFEPEVWGTALVKNADDVASKAYSSFSATGGKKSSTKFLQNMWKPSTTTTSVTETKTISESIMDAASSQFGGQSFSAAQSFAAAGLKTSASIAPQTLILSSLAVKSLVDTKQKPKSIVIPKIDTGIKSTSKSITDLFSATSPDVSSKTGQDFISSTKQIPITKQITEQITESPTTIINTNPPFISPPTGFVPGFKIPLFEWGNKKVGVAAKKSKSYIPQVKHKGKWKTVGKSMDRQSALSRASSGADLTTSRGMRIKPSNKKPEITGISGWGLRQHKFRNYKVSKGKRIPLPQGQFIEKKDYVGDTTSEIKGLSIAKLSKNMGWLKPTKKKKKNKRSLKTKSPWLI